MKESKTVKYVLCPGPVVSQNDGQRHYITATKLAHLYGVDIRKCLVLRKDASLTFVAGPQEQFVYLHPRSDGNYTLPKSNTKGG